jgi:2-polyprenyl-3-methyl-5-hydroxy-6-metoxy-1,4-benzoquinol methylase
MVTASKKSDKPWQLEVFSQGLKKNLKLRLLMKHVGDVSGQQCLLITCGDNNGALNYYFRESGGNWTWADIGEHGPDPIEEMRDLLEEEVHIVKPDALPFPDQSFDCVVVIDVHEHLPHPEPFTRELFRIVKLNGRAIVTVPNGDPLKPVTIFKYMVGMSKEKYGHQRIGYTMKNLKRIMSENGFRPSATGSYSKFFTEMLELVINFAYVRVLSRKNKDVEVPEGTIAPTSKVQLDAVSGSYKMYSRVFPIFKAISSLDRLIFFGTGYAVMVEGKKD